MPTRWAGPTAPAAGAAAGVVIRTVNIKHSLRYEYMPLHTVTERLFLTREESRAVRAAHPAWCRLLGRYGIIRAYAVEVVYQFLVSINVFCHMDRADVLRQMHGFPSTGAALVITPVLLEMIHDLRHGIAINPAESCARQKRNSQGITDAETSYDASFSVFQAFLQQNGLSPPAARHISNELHVSVEHFLQTYPEDIEQRARYLETVGLIDAGDTHTLMAAWRAESRARDSASASASANPYAL